MWTHVQIIRFFCDWVDEKTARQLIEAETATKQFFIFSAGFHKILGEDKNETTNPIASNKYECNGSTYLERIINELRICALFISSDDLLQ